MRIPGAAAWLVGLLACEAGPADSTVQGANDVLDAQLAAPVDAADATEPSDGAVIADAIADSGSDSAAPRPYNGPTCTKHARCQKEAPTTPFCNSAAQRCVQCLIDAHCAADDVCVAHACKPVACTPGATSCDGPFLQTCNTDGKSFTKSECGVGLQCVDGTCLACTPGEVYCAPPAKGDLVSTSVMQCSPDGKTATVKQACAPGTSCSSAKCLACLPGTKTCDGAVAMVCKEDGSGFDVDLDCGKKGWQCSGGQCIDPCDGEGAIKSAPPACESWAVDLPNAGSAQDAPFAVTVANRSTKSALVKVTAGSGQSTVYGVPPGSLKILTLPDAAWKVGPLNQPGTGINKAVYRLEYDREMDAAQFNPLVGASTGSSGATALLAWATLGNDHYAVTRAQSDAGLAGYVTVVAVKPGSTDVTVLPTAPIEASLGNEVPKLVPGAKFSVDLQQGQVLTLASATLGADLTGTRILADKRVAVFAGSQGARAPNAEACIDGKCAGAGWACKTSADCPKVCCADHLEAQLPPTSSWKMDYVAGHFQPRGQAKDLWRVVAKASGTVVKTDPPQTPVPTLDSAEWFEFESGADFTLWANHSVMLVHFMAGMGAPAGGFDKCDAKLSGQKVCQQHWLQLGVAVACETNGDCPQLPQPGQAATGDPEMVVTPAEWGMQARFLCPAGYAAHFATLVSVAGAEILLDGKVIAPSLFGPAGKLPSSSETFVAARVPLTAGQHVIASNKPFYATIHGWSPGVSYAFTAGSAW